MKRIVLLIIGIVLLFSCNDDDKIVFDADPSELEISFQPFPGGAKMNYKFPKDLSIYAIQAEYLDCNNKLAKVRGTYLDNNILLEGFVEAQENIEVKISLLDFNEIASKTITRTFAVGQSPASSIFNNIEVTSHWGGFRITYNGPENSRGFINAAYVGNNIMTGQLDTIVVKTSEILPDNNNIYFSEITDPEIKELTVVVWSEDSKGNKVKRKVYENIPIAFAEIMDCSETELIEGTSEEVDYKKLSYKYLFDGDTQGLGCFRDQYGRPCMFSSEMESVPGEWVFDLKEEKILSYIRLFTPQFHSNTSELHNVLKYYEYMFPNNLEVYASSDNENWDKLSSFYEAPSLAEDARWTWPAMSSRDYIYQVEEELINSPQNYIQLDFDVVEKKYRYIKLNIIETFSGYRQGNFEQGEGRFILQELEVYIKK